MITLLIIYFSILIIGIGSLAVLFVMLHKSEEKLPVSWKKTLPLKHFQIGIFFLLAHLLIILVSELIANYLAFQGIYNSFVLSIGLTLCTPFLFGFLFIYTQTNWKKYSYVFLYAILIGYFIIGGYYHPDCNLPYSSALLFSCVYFLAALIHLTDLLVNPKSEHFRFQLSVNISLLIYNILNGIMTPFHWAYMDQYLPSPELIADINYYITISYYFALDLIIMNEILKLRRSYTHPSTKA